MFTLAARGYARNQLHSTDTVALGATPPTTPGTSLISSLVSGKNLPEALRQLFGVRKSGQPWIGRTLNALVTRL